MPPTQEFLLAHNVDLSVASILYWLQSESSMIKKEAATALGAADKTREQTVTAVNALAKVLAGASKDSDAEVRRLAAAALGRIGKVSMHASAAVVEALSGAMASDLDAEVRTEAARSLKDISQVNWCPAAVEALTRALADVSDKPVATIASDALSYIITVAKRGERAVEAFAEVLARDSVSMGPKARGRVVSTFPWALDRVIVDMWPQAAQVAAKALASVLGGDPSAEVRDRAVDALHRLVTRRKRNRAPKPVALAVLALAKALSLKAWKMQHVRSRAAKVLFDISDIKLSARVHKKAVAALAGALGGGSMDSSEKVRKFAAKALGKIRRKRKQDSSIQLFVVRALASALEGDSRDKRRVVRSSAAKGLGSLSHNSLSEEAAETALNALAKALTGDSKDPANKVRRNAARSFQALRDAWGSTAKKAVTAVTLLCGVLAGGSKDRNAQVRLAAAEALGSFSNELFLSFPEAAQAAVAALVGALAAVREGGLARGDTHATVREAAAMSLRDIAAAGTKVAELGNLGFAEESPAAAARALAGAMIGDPEIGVRRLAAQALFVISDAAAEGWKSTTRVRTWAAATGVVPALGSALADGSDVVVRRSAAKALCRIAEESGETAAGAREALVMVRQEGDQEIRDYASRALEFIEWAA